MGEKFLRAHGPQGASRTDEDTRMIGPGVYDALATDVREKAKARGVILIVFGGDKGHGFSVQLPPELALTVPAILRSVAADIDRMQTES